MHYLDIKKLRMKAKLSQQDLADIMGLTQAQLSWWETGKIKINKVKKLALINVFKDLGVIDIK